MKFKTTKLKKHVIKVGSGVTPKGGSKSYLSAGIPLIRSQNVLKNQLDLSNVAFISPVQHQKMSNSKVYCGDVLLNITGASIGRSCVVPNGINEANVNQHVCIIRLKDSLDDKFLSLFINSWFGQKQVQSFQGGGSREGLNYNDIRNFDLPDFSLHTQRTISNLLSTWDTAIQKHEKLINLKEKQLKWLMNELIYKPVKNGEWKEVKLKEIGNVEKKEKLNNVKGEVLLAVQLHCKGIRRNESFTPKLTLKGRPYFKRYKGEFLIGRQNFHNGGFGIVSPKLDGLIASNAITTLRLEENKIDKWFLWYQFANPNYYKKVGYLMNGTGQKELSEKEILKLKIGLPNLEEQKQIAEILNTAKQEIELLKSITEKYKKQKRGLMQKLLTGQWRVIVEDGE